MPKNKLKNVEGIPPSSGEQTTVDDPSTRVTGSAPGGLGDAAAAALDESRSKGGRGRPTKYMAEKQAAEEAQRAALKREANIKLGMRLAKMEGAAASGIMGDPRYYQIICDMPELQREIAEGFADVAEAYGIEMTGKITSILSFVGAQATVMQQVYGTIKQQDIKYLESQNASGNNRGEKPGN